MNDQLILSHYYPKHLTPFLTLSSLSDEDALIIMKSLYEESSYGMRFKDPLNYLDNRKKTEKWVKCEFLKKGLNPKDSYPIYMTLGKSPWLKKNGPLNTVGVCVIFSLFDFENNEVSFTYPDSMVSKILSIEKPKEIYNKELHGKVFTIDEIKDLISKKGFPEKDWDYKPPENIPPYIEAQIWNYEKVQYLYNSKKVIIEEISYSS